MSLVVLEDIGLSFGSKQIVDGLDFRIAEGDRIGLVGPNGSGKSTLLRILAGQQSPDAGDVRRAKHVRVGYLSQDIELAGGRSLLTYVRESVPGREALEVEIAETQAELDAVAAEASSDPAAVEAAMELSTRLAEQHENLTHFETMYSEHEAMRILAGLGFRSSDHERDLSEFSGGWKMRAALAALLFQRPELLMLDEPTNHLDMPSVAWFGAFLRRYSRAFILICHDREFLNEQIDRVVSFEVEGVRQYRGNFEHYKRQRADEEEVLANQAKNLAREREKAEQFISRFRAQANKAKAVQSRIKALEKMGEVHSFESRRILRFRFPPCARTGAEVIRVEGLSKAFGDLKIFDGLDLRVGRGEKIGIIGVNGAGKTTLLRMIAGELGRDAGDITFGAHVETGYYAQHHADALDEGETIFESVSRIEPEAGATRVRSICGAFLFQGDDVDKPIRVLSGGERARVALARLMIKPGNLLLMDEPTNHLDLESSESLAESLSEYDGTLLFVSHNRSFIRTLATQIWDVSSGRVEVYPGTLDEYLHSCAQRSELAETASVGVKVVEGGGGRAPGAAQLGAPTASGPGKAPEDGGGRRSREDEKARKREEAKRRQERAKRVGPLTKKIAAMESEIETLEVAQKQRSAELAKPEVYEDERRRAELLDAFQADAEKLDDVTARWEMAQAELEAVEADLDG